MPKISVIVPIYNVEKYLNRCIDSILTQTFTDFECILVDDGSPDNCGKICDEYAKKDKRIKVIHKQNGGLSDARNAGIEVAQGEYLSFIDSDDWIHPQMLEILYDGIVKNDVVLSVCAYEETENEKPFEKIESTNFEIRNGMDFLTEDNVTAIVAWNKLYHKSLFENIRYPVGKIHEDEFVTYKILYKAGNVAFCNEKMYMYFVNMNGIAKGKYTIKHLAGLEAWKERERFLKKHKLYKYQIWTKRQLLDGYIKHYYLTGENSEFAKYQKRISREMGIFLLTEGKKIGVDIKHYPAYYEMAFPHFMKWYFLFNIFKEKYAEKGMLFCIKRAVFYILKR